MVLKKIYGIILILFVATGCQNEQMVGAKNEFVTLAGCNRVVSISHPLVVFEDARGRRESSNINHESSCDAFRVGAVKSPGEIEWNNVIFDYSRRDDKDRLPLSFTIGGVPVWPGQGEPLFNIINLPDTDENERIDLVVSWGASGGSVEEKRHVTVVNITALTGFMKMSPYDQEYTLHKSMFERRRVELYFPELLATGKWAGKPAMYIMARLELHKFDTKESAKQTTSESVLGDWSGIGKVIKL